MIAIGIVAACAVLLYLVTLLYFYGRARPGDPPRVWTWVPYVGSAVAFGRRPAAWVLEQSRRLGPAFIATFQGKRTVFITDPFAFQAVFRQKDTLRLYDIAEALVENAFMVPRRCLSLYNKERTQGILQTHLRADEALDMMSERMYRLLVRELKQARSEPEFAGDTVDFQRFCTRVFLAASYDMLMGPGSYQPGMLDDLLNFERALPFLGAGVPLFRWNRKLREGWLHFLSGVKMSGDPDATSPVMAARYREFLSCTRRHGGFRENELRPSQGTIVWAATTNTAPAAFWTVYHITRDPALCRRVRDEIDGLWRAVRARGPDALPTRAEYAALPVLEAVVMEMLRLHTASLILRHVGEDTRLSVGGADVPLYKGDRVALFPAALHHDPEVFEQPEQFRWDRFYSADGQPRTFKRGGRVLPSPTLPFGGGWHMCPGRFLAMHELKLFAALLLRDLELQPLDEARPDRTRVGLGVVPPVGPAPFRVREVAARTPDE